jgi:7-methyl-GTP pyrophosphatase
MEIILASTSPYRKELLERLKIPFRCVAPDTEESRLSGEKPADLCVRLALMKARAVADRFPEAIVIGSDQVASLGEEILSKPGNHERATAQLEKSSSKTVQFHTGLAVCAPLKGPELTHCEPFSVHFRDLDEATIERYLRADEPYNCAGSFKAESLGISLFESMQGNDPTSLIGLPLIALTGLLGQLAVNIP